MLSMSTQRYTQSITTEHGTFSVGDQVIYSDLSPWEDAVIQGFQNGDVDLIFNENELCVGCMTDGLRKHTPENVKQYLGDDLLV